MKTEIKKATILQFYTIDELGNWVCWANLLPVAVGCYSLFQVYTVPKERKKGYATALLQEVIDWVNKNKALIQFEVEGWGEIGMNIDQLYTWYIDLGFEPVGVNSKGNPVLQLRGGKNVSNT